MKKSTFRTKSIYYGIAVVVVVVVFMLPLISKLFSAYDLVFQMSSAVLGVVLSAVITFILLLAQSQNDVQIERDSKVYEQKLAVCMDFLEHLRRVLEDGKVTPQEVNTLKFAFANVAVHVKDNENLVQISQHLQSIISACGPGSDTAEVKKSVVQDTLQIVAVFQDEIYGDTSLKNIDETAMAGICEQLTDMLLMEAEPESNDSENAELSISTPKNRVLKALEAKLSATLDPGLWKVDCPSALEITCLKEGLNTKDAFVIRLTWEVDRQTLADRYYFQCHLSFTDDGVRRAHYLRMRSKLGGGFNKYCWWCYVDDQSERVLSSAEATAEDLTYTVDTCFRKLKDMVDHMTVYMATLDQVQSIAGDLGISAWSLFVWENTIMIFENTAQKFRIAAECNDDDSLSHVRVWMNDGCPDHVKRQLCQALNKEPNNDGCFDVCDRCASRAEFVDKIKERIISIK